MSASRLSSPTPGRTEARPSLQALTHVLLLAGIVSAVFIIIALAGLGGWRYYRSSLPERAFLPAHRLLGPSGTAGQLFGIGGTVVMLATFLYVLRKKSPLLKKLGRQKTWLEAHIFCGLVGPVLITLHTSFKFNGVISVAYWSMVLVVLSGFVGRYLYVRIPRTIRGTELSLGELDARAEELRRRLQDSGLPEPFLQAVARFEASFLAPARRRAGVAGLFLGDFRLRSRVRALRKSVPPGSVEPRALEEILNLVTERAVLIRRIAYLDQTRRLFGMWHVFHKPLVYLMLAIAAIHIALAMYLGYSMLRL